MSAQLSRAVAVIGRRLHGAEQPDRLLTLLTGYIADSSGWVWFCFGPGRPPRPKAVKFLRAAVDETEIDIGSDFYINHAVFASRNLMKFGSSGVLGGTACDPNGITFAAYSLGKFTLQSNNIVSNAQIISGFEFGPLEGQSNNTYRGVTIQAMADILLGSSNVYSSCPNNNGPTGDIAGMDLRLVD